MMMIDEKLEGFGGRCCFVPYISNKPNKYGSKIYAIVDFQVYHLQNLVNGHRNNMKQFERVL